MYIHLVSFLFSPSEENPFLPGEKKQSLEKIYSGLIGDGKSKNDCQVLHIQKSASPANLKPKTELGPPTRVTSPDYLRSSVHVSSNGINKSHFNNQDNTQKQNGRVLRDSRSASPASAVSKLSNSDSNARRVMSLEHFENNNSSESEDHRNKRNLHEKGGFQLKNNNFKHSCDTNELSDQNTGSDFSTKREKIIDNFLTDDEIKRESLCADLY